MISERVLPAPPAGQNRYELCHSAFKAIRRMHHPGNRMQDTTNEILRQLREEGRLLQLNCENASTLEMVLDQGR